MSARRDAFTLFELILAVALSAALLVLIGTAINLYLTQIDASRTRVEQAQLARSILDMIADDLRAATIYDPQDTSAIAQLMASAAEFDVDSIDEPRDTGSPSATGGTSGGNSPSTSSPSILADSATMPLGVNGMFSEVYVDVARPPRREELFSTTTGYTNAPMPASAASATTPVAAGLVPPTDLKTVRYFVRPGGGTGEGRSAATSLEPTAQQSAGGLVRQEIPRPLRLFAEQFGDTSVLQTGERLVAPEVVGLEFRYFDGQQVSDTWDMQALKALPRAIEVRLYIASTTDDETAIVSGTFSPSDSNVRQYRRTVYLPMSEHNSGAPALSDTSSSATDPIGGDRTSGSSNSSFGPP